MSFTSLVKFIYKYFILLDAIINKIAFLFLLLIIFSLIVWHYCIEIQLMLYGHFLPYNFIQVLVMFFLVDSLVFSMYVIMSSTNTAYIAISILNWMLFVHLLPNSSAEML